MGLFLPDVHGAAHDDQKVEAIEVWNCFAGVEFDGAPLMPGRHPECPENARMFDGQVLKYENAHHEGPQSKMRAGLHSGELIYIQEKLGYSSGQIRERGDLGAGRQARNASLALARSMHRG